MTKLRYIIEYAVFRLVGAFFSALPITAASSFSGFGWRVIAPLLWRHKRALANLARAFPEKTQAERGKIARAMWENLGRTFAESFHLEELQGGSRLTFENEALYDMVRARPGGAIFCGSHTGNWEISVLNVRRAGKRPAAVYQRIKNPYVDRYVAAHRQILYPVGLLEPKSAAAAGLLKRAVREGGGAALLVDLRDMGGVAVPFFGVPAPSTIFPALLARALKAPVYIVHVVREDGARFRLSLAEVAQPRSGDRDADLFAATAAIQSAIEQNIRINPEQWMWAHRRWG